MKFYYIREAIRTEETGDEHPQILKMSEKHKYSDDEGVYAFSRFDLPENSPKIKYLLLAKNAKVTDLLNAIMLRLKGFLINEKLKLILIEYNLPKHRFYDAYVKDYANNEYRYWWMQMIINNYDCLDFNKSEFSLTSTEIVNRSNVPIKINSYQDYVDVKSKLASDQRIKISHAYLNDDFGKQSLDVFKINDLSLDWIISERLREDIIKNKITGVDITEANNIAF